MTVTSGINAIAHAAEGLYAPDAQPDHRADGRRRHPRQRGRAAALARRPARPRRAQRCAVRRLAVRHRARRRGDGPAPQAVPHAGRQLQPAARRDAHRGPAACAGLQRGRGARRRWRASRGRSAPCSGDALPRALQRLAPRATARRPRCAPSACRPTAWTAPPTSRSARRTPTRGRWTAPRCARCCSAPTTAPHRKPEP